MSGATPDPWRLAAWCREQDVCHYVGSCDGAECDLAQEGRNCPRGWMWVEGKGWVHETDAARRAAVLVEECRVARAGALL